MEGPQVRLLTLDAAFDGEHNLYRLCKEWRLRFALGATLMGRRVSVWTTHPAGVYERLPWTKASSVKHDDLADYAELRLSAAGPFSFELRDDEHTDTDASKQPVVSGHFQVAPELTVGNGNGQALPLDAIQCVTHLTKLLGPFDQWTERLRVAKECGYNMVHVTPVQQLGLSNSSYSIADHTRLNESMKSLTDGSVPSYEDMGKLVEWMRTEWHMLAICDVVWNHVAVNCPALKECADFGYNMRNSAYMRPAFVLDRALHYFGNEVAANAFATRGLPAKLCQYEHLDAMCAILRADVLPKLELHEFFQVDQDDQTRLFTEHVRALGGPSAPCAGAELHIVLDAERRRKRATVDMQLALSLFNVARSDCAAECDRAAACVSAFGQCVGRLNEAAASECARWTMDAIGAIRGHVEYERVASHGLRIDKLSDKHPLLTAYYWCPTATGTWQGDERMAYTEAGAQCIAFNGWVMADDPMHNFADQPALVYLRRQLVCWGDCVKLRYGATRDTCPPLWDYMAAYTRHTAAAFHGLRLDNCHSTPLNVAEYLLAEARAVRPELYIVAELFTGSEHLDNVFVNHLGITSLIREAQSAPNAHEQGRLVYKYGGEPVGAFMHTASQPLRPMTAHALFMDLTHDNKCPVETRTALDCLPTGAVVSSACCATGSTRGYDELVPYQVNVVTERRLYTLWSDDALKSRQPGYVGKTCAIVAGKRAINDLHSMLAHKGYTQVFVDQMSEDIVAVTRHNPISISTVLVVSRCCFGGGGKRERRIPPIRVSGVLEQIIFELNTVEAACRRPSRSSKDDAAACYLHGMREYTVNVRRNIRWDTTDYIRVRELSAYEQVIEMEHLDPGSVIAFKIGLSQKVATTMTALRAKLATFGFRMQSLAGEEIQAIQPTPKAGDCALRSIVDRMDLNDLNKALFRCEAEEVDDGGGAYNVPHWGTFPYCGILGLMPMLERIRRSNDLGHPLCGNLRGGDWLAAYIVNRLNADTSTKQLAGWYADAFSSLPRVPHYLRPKAFDAIVAGSFLTIEAALYDKMSSMVRDGSEWMKALALATVAVVGRCRSAPLPPVHADVRSHGATLSAGLPHFATGIWRNWGRDTFIAMPGCLMVTGRYSEASELILSYGGMLRHGLIPNLLGDGKCTRYNCRDAVWFWLHAIKLYCERAPHDAYGILRAPVRRMFADDAQMYGCPERVEPLHDTMQQALDAHFTRIAFSERNAGTLIDEHMKDNGFNVSAYIDKRWGFVMGGNGDNCGTWMDKMGSSECAHNRGVPATPRDGAAVELQALAYTVARWLHSAHERQLYPHAGLHDASTGERWSWSQWADTIKDNFELRFWVPRTIDELPDVEHNDKTLVNRRGIVKDTYGASDTWADFQLRPNMCITLALAGDLLDAHKAWHALCVAADLLMGDIGVKTLDPRDSRYNGFYNNNDRSDNFLTANGFNYHNGPEWVWLCGYMLRAQLSVASRLGADVLAATVRQVKRTLARHRVHLTQSAWRSLPELTNEDGAACAGSCDAQAWSVGCMLEVLYDMQAAA